MAWLLVKAWHSLEGEGRRQKAWRQWVGDENRGKRDFRWWIWEEEGVEDGEEMGSSNLCLRRNREKEGSLVVMNLKMKEKKIWCTKLV